MLGLRSEQTHPDSAPASAENVPHQEKIDIGEVVEDDNGNSLHPIPFRSSRGEHRDGRKRESAGIERLRRPTLLQQKMLRCHTTGYAYRLAAKRGQWRP